MQAIALEKILKIQISEKRFIFRTYNKLVIQKQEDKKKKKNRKTNKLQKRAKNLSRHFTKDDVTNGQ